MSEATDLEAGGAGRPPGTSTKAIQEYPFGRPVMARDLYRWGTIIGALTLLLVLSKLELLALEAFPDTLTQGFTFAEWVNAVEDWLRDHYRWLTRGIAEGLAVALKAAERILLGLPWVVVTLSIALAALRYGGLRLALFCVVAVAFWGVVDMWKPAMETLGLIGISVALSVVIGVLVGVACSQSNVLWSMVRPVLDTMQTMPTFVYLIPAIFFFGIGDPPAVAATVIYALPPAVRLTNLGIRQVSAETVEAARAFGSTTAQTLIKVQLPLAMPSIMMGINQTVMMGLAMVVIATFIGAGGLGYEVWGALRRIKVGWALEGGLCIVFMAIMFDRIGYAISQAHERRAASRFRLLPERFEHQPLAQALEKAIDLVYARCGAVSRGFAAFLAYMVERGARLVSGDDTARGLRNLITRNSFLLTSLALLAVLIVIDRYFASFGVFPESWEYSIRKPVDRALNELKVHEGFYAFTTFIRASVFNWILDPLADLLAWVPWWYFTGIVALVAWMSAGRTVALVSVACLLFVGAVGLWSISMFTLATILASVLICMLIGLPIGILAACSDIVESIVRPILDAMQTMPPFVYLVPVLMFFGGNVVSAVIATVIYAVPPLIRLTNLGIREVSLQSIEVSHSFGSTFLQTMTKVKLPLALPSIMMGVNQAVIFAVAMTVITPLIGGAGLGQEVFTALSVVDTGKGFEAGLAIVFIAVIMDRITQAWSRQRQMALGLET